MTPNDELWARTRHLEAERLRVEKPPPASLPPELADLRTLIATLHRLMTNPGPPDAPVSVESGVAQTKDHRNED